MMQLLRSNKAVTLVEILAVIVILGVIAAVAVPTIGNLIENQREKAALAEWDNVKDAARLYALDEDLNEESTFALEELAESGYLTGFNTDSVSVFYYDSLRGRTRPVDKSFITFDNDTGELSEGQLYTYITINGFLVAGEIPTN